MKCELVCCRGNCHELSRHRSGRFLLIAPREVWNLQGIILLIDRTMWQLGPFKSILERHWLIGTKNKCNNRKIIKLDSCTTSSTVYKLFVLILYKLYTEYVFVYDDIYREWLVFWLIISESLARRKIVFKIISFRRHSLWEKRRIISVPRITFRSKLFSLKEFYGRPKAQCVMLRYLLQCYASNFRYSSVSWIK